MPQVENRVNVDLWGPKTIHNKDGNTYKLHAMTMIDLTTGWFEIATLRNGKTAIEAQRLLDSAVWLARYPRPREIGFVENSKQNSENCVTTWESKAQAQQRVEPTIQCNHWTGTPSATRGQPTNLWSPKNADLTGYWSIWRIPNGDSLRYPKCIPHHTVGYSPAQLVFGRDMFMPVNFEADWGKIKQNKQNRIDCNNDRENQKRRDHKYNPGNLVKLEQTGILPTLSLPRMGPYLVIQAHDNGNITIQKQPFVTDRVNIRRCKPYNQLNDDSEKPKSTQTTTIRWNWKKTVDGIHKDEFRSNRPIKTQYPNASSNQNKPKQQFFLFKLFLRNISMEAHAVHRDWIVTLDPSKGLMQYTKDWSHTWL